MKILSLSIFLYFCGFISCKDHDNVFNEELVIKELNNNYLNTFFQFTTRWNFEKKDDLLHTDFLSRSISELFLHYDINELHVSLTNGLWRHESWGYPVLDAGSGAELYVWFKNHLTEVEIQKQWKHLSGALSGLLCASISFVNDENTISPIYSLRPQSSSNKQHNSTFIRYATLPREIVCTENLTPWKKLLPCDPKDGFMSLLNAQPLYSTNYHSLGLHVRQLCMDDSCSTSILESKQTVNLVHDLQIYGGHDWSIRKLFGQGLNGACVLSSSSIIYLDVSNKNFVITPKPNIIQLSKRGGTETLYAEFDIQKLSKNRLFNLAIVNKEDKIISMSTPPPLFVKRFLMGTGKERGKIVNQITNSHWSSLNIVILENVPWFVPIYLHTLKLTVGKQIIQPISVKYIPGKQRVRCYHLEVAIKVPAQSTLELSIDFDYIFLKWQEYPPDAHHGHYIGPALISTTLPMALNYTSVPIDGSLYAHSFNASRQSYYLMLHTEALLINLPTPDFSMPYNVICLACTVVALAFGPLHNMTTKSLMLQKKDEKTKSLLVRLKDKFIKPKEISE